MEKAALKNSFLDAGWNTNLPRFQGARPDHVWVERSSFCFPMALVSFVRSWELATFHQRHMTRPPLIGKRIWVGMHIPDTRFSSRGGYIKYTVALNITKYLAKEEEYVPWAAVDNNLDFLRTVVPQSGSAARYLEVCTGNFTLIYFAHIDDRYTINIIVW